MSDVSIPAPGLYWRASGADLWTPGIAPEPQTGQVFETVAIPDPVVIAGPSADGVVALPAAFGAVSLTRAGGVYMVNAPDPLSHFDGAVIEATPAMGLSAAIAAAGPRGRVNLAPGVYSLPTLSITSDVALIAPQGGVWIGPTIDLASIPRIDLGDGRWSVAGVVGAAAKDFDALTHTRGWARITRASERAIYDALGVPCIHVGSADAKLTQLGGIQPGDVLGWGASNVGSLAVAATVYIGAGIIIASDAPAVIDVSAGSLHLRGEVYGGGQCIRVRGTGRVFLDGARVGCARSDNIDYDASAVGVEYGATSAWPGLGGSNNASTGHGAAHVLRVASVYRGGGRTVHDVASTRAWVAQCQIGDALVGDQARLMAGQASGDHPTQLRHDEVAFFGAGIFDLVAHPGSDVAQIA